MRPTPLRDEPLARFVVLGALVFLADRALSATRARDVEESRRIEISAAFVDGLAARHAARAGGGTEPATEESLVREHVRDEVLYREAMARGLDRGDLIVRRRLVQAMELVLSAELDIPDPGDATLEAFLAEHAETFTDPRRTTLVHVYFARARGERGTADAASALELLRGGGSPEGLGDAFLSGARIGPATDVRLDATLGEEVAAQIGALPVGEWGGPVEGALGVHLVRVEERTEPRVASLREVRTEVLAAWVEVERARRCEAAIDDLVTRYEVVRTAEAE